MQRSDADDIRRSRASARRLAYECVDALIAGNVDAARGLAARCLDDRKALGVHVAGPHVGLLAVVDGGAA